MGENDQDDAEKRGEKNLSAAEMRSDKRQQWRQEGQAGNREHPAEKRSRIGKRQGAARLAPPGHRIAVIGGERIDGRAGRVDQNCRKGTVIHRRSINPEQDGEVDKRFERECRRKKDRNGDADARDGADDHAADRTDRQRRREP